MPKSEDTVSEIVRSQTGCVHWSPSKHPQPALVSMARAAVALCDFCSASMQIYYLCLAVSASVIKEISFFFDQIEIHILDLRVTPLFWITSNHCIFLIISQWITSTKSSVILPFPLISLPPNPSCLTLATSPCGHWWTDPAPDRYESQQGGGTEGISTLGQGLILPLHYLPCSTSPVALYTKTIVTAHFLFFWETTACTTHFPSSPSLIFKQQKDTQISPKTNYLWLNPSLPLTTTSLLLVQY